MMYTRALIQLVLQNYEEIESLKYKITKDLVVDSLANNSDDDFYWQEGNTLLSRGPQTTRIAKNTNRRVEALCDITADIDRARKTCLTEEENLALMLTFTFDGDFVPKETQEIGLASLDRIVLFLNGY